MASIACDLSDQVILTSDNPRSEDPNEESRERICRSTTFTSLMPACPPGVKEQDDRKVQMEEGMQRRKAKQLMDLNPAFAKYVEESGIEPNVQRVPFKEAFTMPYEQTVENIVQTKCCRCQYSNNLT